jgi:actin beta/gamma 1
MFGNVELRKGTTIFQGFVDHISKEITTIIPTLVVKIKGVTPLGRKYSVWIGGFILAFLSTFQWVNG